MNLVRTVCEPERPRRRPRRSQWPVLAKPGPAVELNGHVDDILGHGRHRDLDLRDLVHRAGNALLIQMPGGLEHQQTALLDRDPGLGDALGVAAQLGQRTTEGLASQRSPAGQLKGTLGQTDQAHAVMNSTRPETPLGEAITRERNLLLPLLERADLTIDTTHTTVHQLRDLVRERLVREPYALSLLVESFGYKHGTPQDADFVFDARCLPNPHWQPDLRPLTGRDGPVAEYLGADHLVQAFHGQVRDFLTEWLPAFQRENRSYLTVAVGCTGGQHRSVYLAERLAADFRHQGLAVTVRHRELS